MMFFLGIIEWVKAKLAFIVGGAAAALAAIALIKRSGRQDERVDQLNKVLDSVGKKNETARKVDRLPDGDAARRLRDQWSRD